MTAERETCALLQKGVAAIFGPQNEASASHIRSITDVAEIPFIDTRWHMQPVNPILTTSIGRSDYTVNLHPDASTLSKLIELQNWADKLGIHNVETGFLCQSNFA